MPSRFLVWLHKAHTNPCLAYLGVSLEVFNLHNGDARFGSIKIHPLQKLLQTLL